MSRVTGALYILWSAKHRNVQSRYHDATGALQKTTLVEHMAMTTR